MTKRVPPKPCVKGISGNPAGRPRGTGKVAALRAAIEQDLPHILTALTKKAREGDVAAASLLLARVIAPLKPSEETTPINLPSSDLAEQGRAVLKAVSAGEIAPGQGAVVLASLGALAKLVETDELAARVAELEKRHGVIGKKT